jgi:DNA invertase Pin-like site-specific DNA recombinase
MALNEVINLVNKRDGKILYLAQDAFEKSKFQCSQGHQFEIFNNDIIMGIWCNGCRKKDKLEELLDKLNLTYNKDFILNEHTFYCALTGSRKFLFSKNNDSEVQKKEINIAEKNNYSILFLLDETELEDKLWPILKENKSVNYLEKKITNREHTCVVEEKLDDKKGEAGSVIKRAATPHSTNHHHAYGYIRVSTVMQVNDGFSLEAQESKIAQECRKHNLFLKALFIDRGISGGSIENRLSLEKMRQELKENEWIIIASVSRLARNTKELLELVDEIEKKKAHLIIIDLNLDITSPSGKLILTLMASQAQFERELTSERVKGVLDHLKKTGNLRTKPHFGWKVNPDHSPGAAMHIRDETEQTIIERIRYIRSRHMHLAITGFTRLVNDLNVTPPRKSKVWYHTALRKLMEREGIK